MKEQTTFVVIGKRRVEMKTTKLYLWLNHSHVELFLFSFIFTTLKIVYPHHKMLIFSSNSDLILFKKYSF